ncbi:MAG TPA: pitrilysin family protein [Thermoanaerobaculia bacterium]|nr:pitrilysin family protein [Thermoanaerobaculia bacterium]
MSKPRRLAEFLIVLALASNAFAATPAKSPAVAPINYQHRSLANGLEVYSIENHATPTVSIQVWYRVGSKNDPEGRSGFAHLFEHIMFKATAHMKSEMLDRLTEDVGGMNNAYTHPDRTVYYEIVPSNYLQTLLWAEGERLGSLKIDEDTFKSERDVVKEEYRTRVLAPSYGRLNYAITKDSFAVHPYRRPGIGSIEELDAATVPDVTAFHATYYRPDNAVVIVAGDFDPKQLDTWVDRYLGTIPKPSTAIPRVTVQEPARTEEKHFAEHGANVPLPAGALTWLIPSARSDDAEPLEIAATILSDGDSSRLYQSLVYRKQLAQSAGASANLQEDVSLFTARAIMASGKKPEDGIAALREEIAALAAKQVTAAELEKAKNLIITSALRERETNDGKAGALGEAITQNHDATYVNRGLARLQAVTAADVQRVVKKYLVDGKAVVITYTSEAK